MIIKNGDHSYELGRQVAQGPCYRLYLCRHVETDRKCLLQVADQISSNGKLDRSVFVLNQLAVKAEQAEQRYAVLTNHDPNRCLGYDLQFPEVLDSFVFAEQGDRRINILAFRNVDEVRSIIPIGNIPYVDKRRIDLRTSGWMMGKQLKLLTFVHDVDISVQLVTLGNILIEPDQHYVVIFSWADAIVHQEKVPRSIRRKEIARAAQAIITVLGGNYEERYIPDSSKETAAYEQFILDLAHGSHAEAEAAHKEFYRIVDSIWEPTFYPFTTLPL